MKYKCIGSPDCMKSFEYGHALRAHIAACDKAQKILKFQADIDKLEQSIKIGYPGIHGLHRNPHFPTSHHLDQTLRFEFADKNRFTPKELQDRVLKQVRNPYLMTSNEVKKIFAYE